MCVCADASLRQTGLNLAVLHMRRGEKCLLRVSPEYGYGKQGVRLLSELIRCTVLASMWTAWIYTDPHINHVDLIATCMQETKIMKHMRKPFVECSSKLYM